MVFLVQVLTAAVIASSLSLDAFVAAFAYGSNKIRISMFSMQVINLVCAAILGLSLLVGTVVREYLPEWLTIAICFTTLFLLGITKLLDSITKSIIRKHSNLSRQVKFSLFHFNFILQLYADPEKADVDQSRDLSPAEAVMLALSLSLDGIGVGFGAALGNIQPLAIFIASLIMGFVSVFLGHFLGKKLAQKISCDLSWITGVILIIMAFTKFF